MHNINSFSELLAQGQITEALQLRLEAIEASARHYRQDLEAAKVSSAALEFVGLLLSANPLVAVVAGCGLAGYGYTVLRDYQNTKRLCLLPLVRKGTGELLTGIGLAAANEQGEADDPLLGVIGYVEPELAHEYELVMVAEAQLTGYLAQLPGESRLNAFRHILRHTRLRNSLKLPPLQDVALAIASGTVASSSQSLPPQPGPGREEVPTIEVKATPVEEKPTAPQTVDDKPADIPTQPQQPDVSDRLPANNQQPLTQPTPQQLLPLPLKDRAIAIIEALAARGFDLSRAIGEQITCICGNQRGGKGTLMAILAVLASAIEPNTKIHYFTAGDDIYPFRCDRLICRLNFPKLDGTDADQLVAAELYRYLKEMDNATQGEYSDIILVIDEAVALSDYLDPDQKQWIIRFLLTRANKKGAQIFIVLHGSNLTSWVGTGNTGGFSSTFKTGVTFVGCEATSKKVSPLRSISVATGHYFIASPDDFSKPVEGGELGRIPDWFKTETNPSTGQPDPLRALLKFFPELKVGYVGAIGLEKKDVTGDIRERLETLIKATPKNKIPPQTELAQKVLEIIQSATKYPISFESIRKSRKWESNPPDKTTLLATLEEITPDWIRGSEEEGYYIQD